MPGPSVTSYVSGWASTPASRCWRHPSTSVSMCTRPLGSWPRGTAARCSSRAATHRLHRDGSALRDLGEHRLKDIEEPLSIFQLGEDSFPPLKTISNTNLPRPASSFVGRERGAGADPLADRGRCPTRHPHRARRDGQDTAGARGCVDARPVLQGRRLLGRSRRAPRPALVTETIAQTLGAQDGLAEHIGEREILLLLDNLEQVIEAAPELSFARRGLPQLDLARHEPRASARPGGGRVPGASARPSPRQSPSSASGQARAERRDRRALRPPRFAPARRRTRGRAHESALAEADPRATLAAARPPQGRPRRRSPPADAQGDDRVELRPPLRR